ncbi:MAG: cation diffusion facilitator family transporter [Bacteroidales bacterium]
MTKKDHRYKISMKLGLLSLIANTLLFAIKYYVGHKDQSLAIMADAWHTLSDSASSIILIASIWLAKRPHNDKHPFGYGRVEHIGALFVGVLLVYIGISFISQAYESFVSKKETTFGVGAWIVTILSVFIKEILARITYRQGKKVDSSILIADAWHHRSDALSSLIILVGLLFNNMFWWIDSALSLVVSVMIIKVSIDIFKTEFTSLVGKSISQELEEEIITSIRKHYDTDYSIHHILLHSYGYHREMSCHISLSPSMTLKEVHVICTKLEAYVKEEFGISLTVHPEPGKE